MTPYPSIARDSRTFSEIFISYLKAWNKEIPGMESEESLTEYGNELSQKAKAIAAQHTEVEDGDKLIDDVLRHSIRKFDSARGRFEKLFERNLRERFRKEFARGRSKKRKRRWATLNFLSPSKQNARELEVDYKRWSLRLLNWASVRLDEHTRICLERRRNGVPYKKIADELGTSEQSLLSRYGGIKLPKLVQTEIRRMVSEMPEEHLLLLARHLEEEAGFPRRKVNELLRTAIPARKPVPLLEEKTLLEKIWKKSKIFSEN